MRAAERRKKVIQSCLVGDIDGGERKAPLVMIAFEQVIVPYGEVEEVARRDARWILVVVLGSGSGDLDQGGPIL